MKEFRFSRLVIALVVLMKYMTKISDAGKNPAYTTGIFQVWYSCNTPRERTPFLLW